MESIKEYGNRFVALATFPGYGLACWRSKNEIRRRNVYVQCSSIRTASKPTIDSPICTEVVTWADSETQAAVRSTKTAPVSFVDHMPDSERVHSLTMMPGHFAG